MPPGVVPIGHFLVKTAIFRGKNGFLCGKNDSLFHANSAKVRSPDQVFDWWEEVKVVQIEVVVGV
jgi:hypothetical protein